MSRPVWTGSLTFGPVHVPVKLHGAVEPKQVHFHLLHDADGARLQQKRVCSADGQEVPYAHVVKGYDMGHGRYVELTPGELEALDPQASRSIDLEDFVELSSIDPIYFDTTYHLMPAEGAWRPYASVAMALRASGRVGIGRLVMYQKGHLCAVRPFGRGLVLTTLHYADELVSQDSFAETAAPGPRPQEQEVASILTVLETRTTDWEPRRYHDVHRERMLAFIERRARNRGFRPEAPLKAPAPELPPPPSARPRAARGVRPAERPHVSGTVEEVSVGGALRARPSAMAREARERPPESGAEAPGTPPGARRRRKDSGQPS
jgi:DNA end-binding protein Ku